MARRQKNMYTLTHSDGRETKVVASNYDDVAKAIRTFNIDAVTIQREYKDSKRRGTARKV